MNRTVNCPQCASDLTPVAYEGVSVHACDTCGGEFLASDELRGLAASHRGGAGDELCPADRRLRSACPAGVQRSLCCPECGEPMDAAIFGGETGILVDRCGSCEGLWIDRQELERIQELRRRWSERCEDLATVGSELESARRRAAERSGRAFAGSRFALVSAVIGRFLELE